MHTIKSFDKIIENNYSHHFWANQETFRYIYMFVICFCFLVTAVTGGYKSLPVHNPCVNGIRSRIPNNTSQNIDYNINVFYSHHDPSISKQLTILLSALIRGL